MRIECRGKLGGGGRCVVVKSPEYGVSVKGTTTTPGSVKNVPIFNILDQVSASAGVRRVGTAWGGGGREAASGVFAIQPCLLNGSLPPGKVFFARDEWQRIL